MLRNPLRGGGRVTRTNGTPSVGARVTRTNGTPSVGGD